LLELNGQDLRRLPVEVRKAGLAELLRKPSSGIALKEHYVEPRRNRLLNGAAFNCVYLVVCRIDRWPSQS